MQANVDLLFLPYATANDQSLLHILINQFKTGKWKNFFAAVAFAKQSGNYPDLLQVMKKFALDGGSIRITVGADTFGGNAKGTEYVAIENLLQSLEHHGDVKIYLYHEENNRTFHPKIYIFSNDNGAKVIIGSSNWTSGGFWNNVEANVILDLNFIKDEHLKCYDSLIENFETYWQEKE